MNPKFYIFAPAQACSGGPEALHQLAYYMQGVGMDAYVVYYSYSEFPIVQTVDRYLQYGVSVVPFDMIEDKEGVYVIAPENAPWCLNGFNKAQKCIWWLSYAYNDVKVGSLVERVAHLKRKVFGQMVDKYRNVDFNLNNCWHLCGSKYAFEEVSKRLPKARVDYLVEPISLDFLKMGNAVLPTDREDVVLYNPSKPSAIMKELLERNRFKYVPLKGFTPAELAERYKTAKLYVDFGLFGGPERMPKEAVYYGCNILVADHNAAANDFDVAIPEKYKVDDGETAEQIESRIFDMMEHYEAQHADFLPFKEKVEQLEENYVNQLKELFLS